DHIHVRRRRQPALARQGAHGQGRLPLRGRRPRDGALDVVSERPGKVDGGHSPGAQALMSGPGEAIDRALVEGFLARRGEADFLALYRRHTPALLGLASRLSGRPPREAEDLVQEAWLRAAPALSAFRWESSLRTWLSGFVVNVWREGRRLATRE